MDRSDADTDYQESRGKPASYPGTSTRTYNALYERPGTKVCYFYKDGDATFPGIKLAVNPRYYHDVEGLKNELTKKVKAMNLLLFTYILVCKQY